MRIIPCPHLRPGESVISGLGVIYGQIVWPSGNVRPCPCVKCRQPNA